MSPNTKSERDNCKKVGLLYPSCFLLIAPTRNAANAHANENKKAGALKYGLSLAKGEMIAIFDADFLPSKNFLHKRHVWMKYNIAFRRL